MSTIIYLSNFVQLKLTSYITEHVSDVLVQLKEIQISKKKWSQFHPQGVGEETLIIKYSVTKRIVGLGKILFEYNFHLSKDLRSSKLYHGSYLLLFIVQTKKLNTFTEIIFV